MGRGRGRGRGRGVFENMGVPLLRTLHTCSYMYIYMNKRVWLKGDMCTINEGEG